MRLLTLGVNISLSVLPAGDSLFSYWVALSSLTWEKVLFSFYCIFFCSVWLAGWHHLETCSFLKRRRGRLNLGDSWGMAEQGWGIWHKRVTVEERDMSLGYIVWETKVFSIKKKKTYKERRMRKSNIYL